MRLVLLALALSLSAGLARSQAVESGQLFRWQQFELRAPVSPGWVLVSVTPKAVAFMRRSDELARSEVATVSVFALPEALDREGFAAWVERAVQAEAPPSRFRPLTATSDHVDERGHACVRHHHQSLDLKARGLPAGSAPPLLDQVALYCRHPSQAGSGFAAVFSTRGPGRDPTLPERARSFIDGVQFPAPADAAAAPAGAPHLAATATPDEARR